MQHNQEPLRTRRVALCHGSPIRNKISLNLCENYLKCPFSSNLMMPVKTQSNRTYFFYLEKNKFQGNFSSENGEYPFL